MLRLLRWYLLVVVVLATTLPSASAQETFWSRLYFPFEVGRVLPVRSGALQGGSVEANGLEYRFPKHPVFLRFSYVNSRQAYRLGPEAEKVVVEGTLHTDYLLMGGGLRRRWKKFALLGALQTGIAYLQQPRVTPVAGGFRVDNAARRIVAARLGGGLEYYPLPDFGLTLEASLTVLPGRTAFENGRRMATVSLGITTTLF